ncbi:MAG TPA: hypothetical protein VFV51_11315, partial [Vicinamibacterales bacterium]|nr:hypothetical protein [Vicinamibacterales bacterium]
AAEIITQDTKSTKDTKRFTDLAWQNPEKETFVHFVFFVSFVIRVYAQTGIAPSRRIDVE